MHADAARALAEVLADDVTRVLDQPVRSVVLHGSLASGAYVPGRSDIDLLFVVDAPLGTSAKQAALETTAWHLRDRAVGVDLRVATAAMAASPARLPTVDLGIGAHAPEFVPVIDTDVATDTDPLVEFAVCRAHGDSIRGLAALEVIAPVPEQWLLETADAEIGQWQQLHNHTGSEIIVTLTACRIWRYAEERLFCAKADAARWVLERAPDCLAVEQALRIHEAESVGPVDQSTIPVLLERVREAVQQALRTPA